jgi:coronin-1B/1C/6
LQLTGGDDCAVRLSIIPDGGLTSTLETAAASLDGHQKKVHTVNFHPTASNVCGTAGYDSEYRASSSVTLKMFRHLLV